MQAIAHSQSPSAQHTAPPKLRCRWWEHRSQRAPPPPQHGCLGALQTYSQQQTGVPPPRRLTAAAMAPLPHDVLDGVDRHLDQPLDEAPPWLHREPTRAEDLDPGQGGRRECVRSGTGRREEHREPQMTERGWAYVTVHTTGTSRTRFHCSQHQVIVSFIRDRSATDVDLGQC